MKSILLCSVLLLSIGARGQQFVNAKVETLASGGSLQNQISVIAEKQSAPAWIGYSVPIVPGNHRICCYNSEDSRKPRSLRKGHCNLEGHDNGMNFQTNSDDADAQGGDHLIVLLRAADNRIDKLRVFTDDCELDAGGLAVHWIESVEPKQSIKFLETFVPKEAPAKSEKKLGDSAISAIALHNEAAADEALGRFVEPSRPLDVRKDAAFWMGNVRGKTGFEALRRLIHNDKDAKLREQCIFALHICKEPDAVKEIIEIARKDESAHVRGQALFWLGQKAGEKAAATLTDAIENDPDTDVKKKAVFGLSQLPKDEGIPKLIEVARKNRNREVRKDALFWLGQSNTPQALAFFEEILTH
jgi:hypothetical protein